MTRRSTSRFYDGKIAIEERVVQRDGQDHSLWNLDRGDVGIWWEVDELRKLHDLIEELIEQDSLENEPNDLLL